MDASFIAVFRFTQNNNEEPQLKLAELVASEGLQKQIRQANVAFTIR